MCEMCAIGCCRASGNEAVLRKAQGPVETAVGAPKLEDIIRHRKRFDFFRRQSLRFLRT